MHPKTCVLAIFLFGACLVVWTWSCLNSTKEIAKKKQLLPKKQSKTAKNNSWYESESYSSSKTPCNEIRYRDPEDGWPSWWIAWRARRWDRIWPWPAVKTLKTPGKISCFFETKPAGRELFQWGIKLKFSINLQHHISCWFVVSSGIFAQSKSTLEAFLTKLCWKRLKENTSFRVAIANKFNELKQAKWAVRSSKMLAA